MYPGTQEMGNSPKNSSCDFSLLEDEIENLRSCISFKLFDDDDGDYYYYYYYTFMHSMLFIVLCSSSYSVMVIVGGAIQFNATYYDNTHALFVWADTWALKW